MLVADLSGTLQPADRTVVVGEAGEKREAEEPLSLELRTVGCSTAAPWEGRMGTTEVCSPLCQWWESCWLRTVTLNIGCGHRFEFWRDPSSNHRYLQGNKNLRCFSLEGKDQVDNGNLDGSVHKEKHLL
jgi:hypothetical protein